MVPALWPNERPLEHRRHWQPIDQNVLAVVFSDSFDADLFDPDNVRHVYVRLTGENGGQVEVAPLFRPHRFDAVGKVKPVDPCVLGFEQLGVLARIHEHIWVLRRQIFRNVTRQPCKHFHTLSHNSSHILVTGAPNNCANASAAHPAHRPRPVNLVLLLLLLLLLLILLLLLLLPLLLLLENLLTRQQCHRNKLKKPDGQRTVGRRGVDSVVSVTANERLLSQHIVTRRVLLDMHNNCT